jgi:UDP-N-acetylmuramoyl-L-alanyl-D-glutamate--2,6-diaminopimelate ligase
MTSAGTLTYALDRPADITAKEIKFDISHSEFTLVSDGRKNLRLRVPLIGRHNVYNLLACIGWSIKEGLALETIQAALENFSFVPGRLEAVQTNRGFSLFVDYAHTEDALSNVIRTLREVSRGRIIVVFGCGGERDRAKRPKMGAVVTELADYAIITNDNPRSEEPLDIIEEIKQGINKDNYCVIPDRFEAIRESLSIAGDGDIVLVAGKGHENYQIIKNKRREFDDRQVVKKCLASMKS